MEEILHRHGVRYTLEWYVSGRAVLHAARGRCREAVSEAVYEVSGRRPKLSTGGGTSDGRFIAPLGAQVVELGVMNATIHKVNESVRVADIDALHAMYFNVLRRLLGLRLRDAGRSGRQRAERPQQPPRRASRAPGSAS